MPDDEQWQTVLTLLATLVQEKGGSVSFHRSDLVPRSRAVVNWDGDVVTVTVLPDYVAVAPANAQVQNALSPYMSAFGQVSAGLEIAHPGEVKTTVHRGGLP